MPEEKLQGSVSSVFEKDVSEPSQLAEDILDKKRLVPPISWNTRYLQFPRCLSKNDLRVDSKIVISVSSISLLK